MDITNEIKNQMAEIIKNKEIKSVFQPIVSLKTGTIYGYEALSRITLKKCSFNIGEAFEIAQELNCLWALENIISKNRLGFIEEFPLATLSAAAITNREQHYESIRDLSLVIAQTKKRAKHQTGNSLVIT